METCEYRNEVVSVAPKQRRDPEMFTIVPENILAMVLQQLPIRYQAII